VRIPQPILKRTERDYELLRPNRPHSSEVGHWFSKPLLRFRSRPSHRGGFSAHRPETSGPHNVSHLRRFSCGDSSGRELPIRIR